MPHPVSGPEFARLSTLFRYGILDTRPEMGFDQIVGALARNLNVPVVRLAFADDHRLWSKAAVGVVECETPRIGSLDDLVISEKPLLVISDVVDDALCNGRILTDPTLRAFAGLRLQSVDDEAIGVLSVADVEPRRFNDADLQAMQEAVHDIMALLESRRRSRIDPASGALIREAFLDQMDRIAQVTLVSGQSLSLVLLDLADLRASLDARQPGLATMMMRRVADLGRDQVRRRDSFGRLDGDRFAVLLTDTDEPGARILARRLSDSLTQGWSALIAAPASEVIPVGIALLQPGAKDGSSLLVAADRACRNTTRCERPALVA